MAAAAAAPATPAAAPAAATLSQTAAELYRIRRTVCAMLDKRGFVVLEEDRAMTVESFLQTFGEAPSRRQLTMLVARRDAPEDRLIVFFPDDDVGVPHVKQ